MNQQFLMLRENEEEIHQYSREDTTECAKIISIKNEKARKKMGKWCNLYICEIMKKIFRTVDYIVVR
jgi:hypothetical protein